MLEARNGRVGDFEATRRATDGALHWWHVVLNPVFDVAQEPEFILVILRNVTDRRQAQDLLQSANADLKKVFGELRRSNEYLEQFARVAGYDLRARLGTMIMFAQILERQCSSMLGDQGRQHVARIIEAGKRMMTLLEDLLRYAAFTQEPVERRHWFRRRRPV